MKHSTTEVQAKDGKKIFVQIWLPDDEVKAVIQVTHGMAEHSGRYSIFAEYMASHGFAVYAHDQRGHGQTEKDLDKIGFLAEKDGWQLVVDDLLVIQQYIKEQHRDKKIILLGHSFGSMVVRAFMIKYGEKADGYIISGTTGMRGALLGIGKMITSIQALFKGKRAKSKLMDKMSFGKYNSFFKPNQTEFDWLSKDMERNQNYVDDPYCGTVFSNGFFFDMLSLIQFIVKNISKTYKEKPVFIFSGAKDPVGDFGKGVEWVYNKFKAIGVKDLTFKLYEDGRHEMLNETNRNEVYQDITDWIEKNVLSV